MLWVVSLFTFAIFVVLPSEDPARRLAGKSPTPETMALARHSLGLDKPITVQYARFAKGLVPIPGWFLNEQVYYSYGTEIAVKDEIAKRLPWTLALTVGAAIMWMLMGVPIGIISALKKGKWQDRLGMTFALIGISAPGFLVGITCLWLFHYVVPVFPPGGIPVGTGVFQAVIAGNLWLPWFTLAFTSAAVYARVVRANLLESMGEDYVRTARAKGLSNRVVTFKHASRAGLTPLVTMFGLDVGFLLGGAFITEKVFNIPGIGKYGLDALITNDFPATMGVTVVSALFIVISTILVDVLYAVLDPRVKYE